MIEALLTAMLLLPSMRDAIGPDRALPPQDKKPKPAVELKTRAAVEKTVEDKGIVIEISPEMLKELTKKSDEHSSLPSRTRTLLAGVSLTFTLALLGILAAGAEIRHRLARVVKIGLPLGGLVFAFSLLSGFAPDVAPGPGPKPAPKPTAQETPTEALHMVNMRLEGPVTLRVVKGIKAIRVELPVGPLTELVNKSSPGK